MTATDNAIRSIPCPTCGAERLEYCKSKRGRPQKSAYGESFHSAREQAYFDSERQPAESTPENPMGGNYICTTIR